MTRIDKFNHSFEVFMETFSIEKWTFTKTEPKHTGSCHTFHLNIPFEYIDVTPQAIDGNIEWEETAKIQDNIPSRDEFETKFDEYFGDHCTYVWNCVYIHDHHYTSDDGHNATIKLRLSNGKPLPFPIPRQ